MKKNNIPKKLNNFYSIISLLGHLDMQTESGIMEKIENIIGVTVDFQKKYLEDLLKMDLVSKERDIFTVKYSKEAGTMFFRFIKIEEILKLFNHEEKKRAFSKLLKIDSDISNSFLSSTSLKMKMEVMKNKNNDEIFQKLELLEEFIYKVPEIALDIVRDIIKNKKTNRVKKYKTKFGTYDGKNYEDLVLKCVELLSYIKYIKTEDVFEILIDLKIDGKISEKSKDAIKNLTKYNYFALKNIGYTTQRKILDIILGWKEKKRDKYLEIINLVVGEFLQFEFEGTEMVEANKMVFKSGPLSPTDYLKKIRVDSINLIMETFNHSEDIKEKISLLNVLENASRVHSSIDEKGRKFVADDLNYIVGFYEKVIFDKKSSIIAEAPIILEIENRLYWMSKGDEFIDKKKIENITKKIREDEFYGLYRMLIGDVVYHEGGYEAWQKKKDDKIDDSLKKINDDNVNGWIETLDNIAKYKNVIEGWTLQGFNNFMQRIAEEKPMIAEMLLDDAFKNKKPLINFVDYFLSGFRRKNNVILWDRYVEKIIEIKSSDLLSTAFVSLMYIDAKDIKKVVRQSDIDLLRKSIVGKGKYKFLRAKGTNKLLLHSSLFSGLLQIFEKNPIAIEKLIIEEMESNQELLSLYVRELDFMNSKRMAHISNWSNGLRNYILKRLVELSDLDHSAQNILLGIGEKYFDQLMEVFLKRIQKADKENPKKKFKDRRYNAIPYHFNDDLIKYISEDQKNGYLEYVSEWSEKMTKDWSVYNWELGEFIEKMNLSFADVLKNIINRGDKKSFNNAIDILRTVNVPPFEICFEIVKKTTDKEVLDRVESVMYSTGTVMGVHGFSEAYKEKVKLLEDYVNKNEGWVKKFALRMIEKFKEKAEEERKREDEMIQLRKIEFEAR
jgi:hypothetical protein